MSIIAAHIMQRKEKIDVFCLGLEMLCMLYTHPFSIVLLPALRIVGKCYILYVIYKCYIIHWFGICPPKKKGKKLYPQYLQWLIFLSVALRDICDTLDLCTLQPPTPTPADSPPNCMHPCPRRGRRSLCKKKRKKMKEKMVGEG